jgi:hypothetical protein
MLKDVTLRLFERMIPELESSDSRRAPIDCTPVANEPEFSDRECTKTEKVLALNELSSQGLSNVERVIRSTSSFLPYMKKMLPHLMVLGTALEVEDYTAAVTDAPGAPKTKCIKILKRWLDSTPKPTWMVFCEKLKKAEGLNRVRRIIQAEEL